MTSVMSDNAPDNMQCTAYPVLRNCNWLDLKVNKYHAKKKTEKRNGMSFTWWAGDTIMAWLSGLRTVSKSSLGKCVRLCSPSNLRHIYHFKSILHLTSVTIIYVHQIQFTNVEVQCECFGLSKYKVTLWKVSNHGNPWLLRPLDNGAP